MTAEAEQLDLFYRFGAALLIGLLVGLHPCKRPCGRGDSCDTLRWERELRGQQCYRIGDIENLPSFLSDGYCLGDPVFPAAL